MANEGLKIVGISALIVMTLTILFLLGTRNVANASAPSGIAASQYIATTTQVGPQVNVQLFKDSSGSCTSRIISTNSQGIMITFADPTNGDVSSTTLTGAVGFWQGPSTTVAYDSGLYGCGRAFGYAGASTTITTASMR